MFVTFGSCFLILHFNWNILITDHDIFSTGGSLQFSDGIGGTIGECFFPQLRSPAWSICTCVLKTIWAQEWIDKKQNIYFFAPIISPTGLGQSAAPIPVLPDKTDSWVSDRHHTHSVCHSLLWRVLTAELKSTNRCVEAALSSRCLKAKRAVIFTASAVPLLILRSLGFQMQRVSLELVS